jgi:hypothetical protein
MVLQLYAGGFSQRRMAKVLRINRKTVVRKLIFLGIWSLEYLRRFTLERQKAKIIEFDDVETAEHTKCKPLSITLAVEHKTRWILGFRVSTMPAKGKLAAIAKKKYGPRHDGRKQARKDLFEELKHYTAPGVLIKSDKNPHYVPDVKEAFPESEHLRFKGRRGCVVGQGELKRGGYDPLFSLNHTAAMLRANINRLFRRTWCVTKKQKHLEYHLAIYALYHNLALLKPADRAQFEQQMIPSLAGRT